MACRGPGSERLGRPAVVGAPAPALSAQRQGLAPVFDLPLVGMSQLEDEQHGLSGDAADPSPTSGLDGFGERAFCVTVVSLDAVAQPEVDLLPLLAPILEGLPVLGSVGGGQGDAALAADLERPRGARPPGRRAAAGCLCPWTGS